MHICRGPGTVTTLEGGGDRKETSRRGREADNCELVIRGAWKTGWMKSKLACEQVRRKGHLRGARRVFDDEGIGFWPTKSANLISLPRAEVTIADRRCAGDGI